jgi:NTE family protein
VSDAAVPPKRINLALQGGGAHGAFTWGVLDALMEDGRLDVEAISGASAGSMNAVVYAEGFKRDGRAGVREALRTFWLSVSNEGVLTPLQRKIFDAWFGAFNLAGGPILQMVDALTHYASPYEFNPLNLNPLRDHLVKMVDFDAVRAETGVKLFIAATNVRTGKAAIFTRDELTADKVMASACLPQLFQAVEIDGAAYWDGGYMGNPPLWPLTYESSSEDTIIVQINPIMRPDVPKTVREIQNRINEITFNGALLGELRAINFVSRLVDRGALHHSEYKRPRIHRIGGDGLLAMLSADTKSDTNWGFLTKLRDLGRAAARRWLAENFDAIGVRGTMNLHDEVS